MKSRLDPYPSSKLIVRVSDKFACGEVSLIEFDPKELKEAKGKVEAERTCHRNYARKKFAK